MPVLRDGSYGQPRPRYWLYIYFRFHRREDGKIVSGLRPFSKARHDVYCDYNNIKLLPVQANLDFQYE